MRATPIPAIPDTEADDRRPVILCIYPGPTHGLAEVFERRLELLSEFFRGYVLTSALEAETGQMSDFEVVAIAMPNSRLTHGARYLRQIEVFKRNAAHEDRIELIVAYDPLLCGLVGLAASRTLGVPLVVEVNGDFDEAANYIKAGRGRISQRARRLRNAWTARRVLRHADGIKLLYQGQLENLGFTPHDQAVAVFPDFTATDMFVDLGERPEILLTGYPYHVKGVDILLDAFLRISPKHPDWTLRILGFYPDKSCFPSEALSHPRIELLDPVAHSEVPAVIGRCGIFVLPSRTEGMGRVLLEAMAAGKPRVGTRVGGIPTTIEDGFDGLLVPPNDPGALADALSKLIGSPALRRSLGEHGARRARTEFSGETDVRKHKSFYERVLAGRSNAASSSR